MQSQVESSTAVVELCRVKQSEVALWQNNVESSRVKYSYGRVVQTKVERITGMVK